MRIIAAVVFCTASLLSCHKQEEVWDGQYDSVTIYVAEAYNNLSDGISGTSPRKSQSKNSDLQDLCLGAIPGKGDHRALFAFCHNTYKDNDYDYKTPNSPVLIRIYRESGQAVLDTIKVYPEETVSASASTLSSVLSLINKNYSSDHYGIVYSSHGSGWLPANYYSTGKSTIQSVGSQFNGSSKNTYEIDIPDFAACIPMHLDYVMFDACLMGGIEVAWELKNVCDRIVFSPTEIFKEGFYYTSLADNLVRDDPDLEQACRDYMDHYSSGATISLVKCSELDQLASIVKRIIAAHPGKVWDIECNNVQKYYTGNHPWFFDLRDMIRELGASARELAELDSVLSKCIIFKDYTPEFGKDTSYYIKIERYSGLSCYIPRTSYASLNDYYRKIAWNKVVGLVE